MFVIQCDTKCRLMICSGMTRTSSTSRGIRWSQLRLRMSDAGRYLIVVLERLYEDVFRPITAYQMKEEDQRTYRQRMAKRRRG